MSSPSQSSWLESNGSSSSNSNSNSLSNSNNNVVATWLHGIGLDYAIEMFDNAGIVTPIALAELDVTFFPALGIHNSDDRRKLFYLVQRVKMQYNTTAAGNNNSKSTDRQQTNNDTGSDAITASTSMMTNYTNTTIETTTSRNTNTNTNTSTRHNNSNIHFSKKNNSNSLSSMMSSSSWHANSGRIRNNNSTGNYNSSNNSNDNDNDNCDQLSKSSHCSYKSASASSSNSLESGSVSVELSPRRRAILERKRQQQQQQQQKQQQLSSETNTGTSTSTGTTIARSAAGIYTNSNSSSSNNSNSTTSSPLAAIKSRMRRLENTRQPSREVLVTTTTGNSSVDGTAIGFNTSTGTVTNSNMSTNMKSRSRSNVATSTSDGADIPSRDFDNDGLSDDDEDDHDEFFDSVEEVDTNSDERRQSKRQQRTQRSFANDEPFTNAHDHAIWDNSHYNASSTNYTNSNDAKVINNSSKSTSATSTDTGIALTTSTATGRGRSSIDISGQPTRTHANTKNATNIEASLSIPSQNTRARRSARIQNKQSLVDHDQNGVDVENAVVDGTSTTTRNDSNIATLRMNTKSKSAVHDTTRAKSTTRSNSKAMNPNEYRGEMTRSSASASARKITMTADEVLDGATTNDTSLDDSFSSSVATTTTTGAGYDNGMSSSRYSNQRQRSQPSQQQPPTRRSNLPAPNRRVEQVASRSSLAQPAKSIRTGKQLSSVPANDVLPMSPLMNNLPNQLVSNYDDEDSDKDNDKTNESIFDFDTEYDDDRQKTSNVTTRRNSTNSSKPRSSLKGGTIATGTNSDTIRKHGIKKVERQRSTSSYGSTSASLVSDDDNEEVFHNDKSYTSDITTGDRHRLNHSVSSVSTATNVPGVSSRRANGPATTNRRSSIERPRSSSVRRDGNMPVSGISAPRITIDYALCKDSTQKSKTNESQFGKYDQCDDDEEQDIETHRNNAVRNPNSSSNSISQTGERQGVVTRSDPKQGDQRKRRESFQTVGITINDRDKDLVRTRSLSRSRRSLNGLADAGTGTNYPRNAQLLDASLSSMQVQLNASSNNIVNSTTNRISNTTVVSYQGQKEDDSFKAQIQSLRQDVDADHQFFVEANQWEHSADTDDHDMRIRVIIRKRPMTRSEIASAGDVDIIHPLDYSSYGKVLVYQPKTRVDLTKEIETISFAFDNVFDEMKTNVDIYHRAVRHMIPSFFQGQWTSIFAYGQTGSGKTYTMMGCNMTGIKDGSSNPDDVANLGLYYMAALDIFRALQLPEHKDLTLSVSLFEIYAGKLFDLLNDRKPVKCLEDARGKVCFPGLSEHGVSHPDDLIALIEKGAQNRSTGTTSRNADSSRSHAVLQLHLRKSKTSGSTAGAPTSNTTRMTAQQRIAASTTAASRRNATGTSSSSSSSSSTNVEFSRLTFIDLAGSERGADTQSASRATRLEGAEINTSLLALKEVIRALAKNDQSALAHVPFRGSKLTQVLKESFVGKQSKCIMIACISPNIMNCEQTLNTLRYADRVKERNCESGQLGGLASGQPSNASERGGMTSPMASSSSNAYRMLSEQFSQTASFGGQFTQASKDSYQHVSSVANNATSYLKQHDSQDYDDDSDFDLLESTMSSSNARSNQSHPIGVKNVINSSGNNVPGSPKLISHQPHQVNRRKPVPGRNQQDLICKYQADYGDNLLSDDEPDSRRSRPKHISDTGSQLEVHTESHKATELFEPTPRSRSSYGTAGNDDAQKGLETNTTDRVEKIAMQRQSSDHSFSSNSSAVLDALLATPHDGAYGKARELQDRVEECLNDEEDVDDLASHYGNPSVNAESSRRSPRRSIRHIETIHTGTPSSTATRNQDQVRQKQLESEKEIISSELIAAHKKALTSMLQMIKDEMVLVNSADTDRELFLNDYVTQVQGVHEKQLEWIATLREHLLKYRIISNAASVRAAYSSPMRLSEETHLRTSNQGSGKTLQRNVVRPSNASRHHHDILEDGSFEDLRD